jgi:hypothetical protein
MISLDMTNTTTAPRVSDARSVVLSSTLHFKSAAETFNAVGKESCMDWFKLAVDLCHSRFLDAEDKWLTPPEDEDDREDEHYTPCNCGDVCRC